VDDLTRQPHEGVQERFEFHPEHAMFFWPLLLTALAVAFGQVQRPPGFQVPGQRM
jgi:hypothetical protein